MRAVLAVLVALAACTPAPGAAPAPDGTVVRSGTVRVVGSAPVNVNVVLQEEGGSTYLTGPLAGELRNAAGARVEITGRMEGRYLAATDYRVVSVDGNPVWMGIVERTASGATVLRTANGEAVPLVGAADRLRPGQKVWVQGPTETAIRVQTYGVLRP